MSVVVPVRVPALRRRRSRSDARAVEHERADRAVVLATSGLVAYVLLTSAWFVQIFVNLRSGPSSHAATDVLGLALCLPVLIALLLLAVRDSRSGALIWLLAVLVVIFGATATSAGVVWLFFAQFVAGAILVALPFRWAWPLFIAAVLAVVPVTHAEHQPQWTTYMTVKTLEGGLCLAVLVALVRTVRKSHAARVELAQQAVVAERLRIGESLADAITDSLERIVRCGEQAFAAKDPDRLADVLGELVALSRQTLTNTRRRLASYQDVSAEAELQTAVTLLAGAGVPTGLELPEAGAPARLDARLRTELRAALGRVLAADDVGKCLIALTGPTATGAHELSVAAEPRSRGTSR